MWTRLATSLHKKTVMENIFHVHEILEMISFSNKAYNRENLIEEIKTTFGEDANFMNCADQILTPEEVLDFLIKKKKVVLEDKLVKSVGKPC